MNTQLARPREQREVSESTMLCTMLDINRRRRRITPRQRTREIRRPRSRPAARELLCTLHYYATDEKAAFRVQADAYTRTLRNRRSSDRVASFGSLVSVVLRSRTLENIRREIAATAGAGEIEVESVTGRRAERPLLSCVRGGYASRKLPRSERTSQYATVSVYPSQPLAPCYQL